MEHEFVKFNEWMNEKGALDPTNAEYIYNSIVESPLKNDPEYKDLWDNIIDAAIKYATIRASWYSWNREKRSDEDENRSSKHNAFISRINIFVRYAKEKGDVCLWKDVLGDERKRIGDFACYIALTRSMSAR